jgi:hypothetical protein
MLSVLLDRLEQEPTLEDLRGFLRIEADKIPADDNRRVGEPLFLRAQAVLLRQIAEQLIAKADATALLYKNGHTADIDLPCVRFLFHSKTYLSDIKDAAPANESGNLGCIEKSQPFATKDECIGDVQEHHPGTRILFDPWV